MFKFSAPVLALLSLTSSFACGGPKQRCTPNYDVTNLVGAYEVTPTATTPLGIEVDSSGNAFDPARIDSMTEHVQACLTKAFPDNRFTSGQQQAAWCPDTVFKGFCPKCLILKIVPWWRYSDDGTQQLLPYIAGKCSKPGQVGDCYFRAAVQDGLTIVVPPSIYLYKTPLVSIATGCRNPWAVPELAACMQPE
jgi:hypothetical protein